jgi:putative membrane protein
MVKIFSTLESEQIAEAIALAEQRTHAEIATVVLPRSDHYVSEMMLYGFILGSVISFILWEAAEVDRFSLFFLIQLLCMFLVPFTPGLKRVLLYFLPKKLLFHRAAHIGAEELLAIIQNVPPQTPVVLLFISLAEHYIHVLPNPIVNNKIEAKNWDKIIGGFTVTLKNNDLTKACIETINEIANILAPIFPDDKGKNLYEDVIHYGKRSKK